MTAATGAQRQANLKARRKAAGLVRVTVWVYPESREHIKKWAVDAVEAHKVMSLYRGLAMEEYVRSSSDLPGLTKNNQSGKMRET